MTLTAREAPLFPHTKSKRLVIIFLGPPGAGKGTHAISLHREIGLPHLSTGALFREHIRAQTRFGLMAQKHIDQGRLVPDEIVLEMVFDRVSWEDCQRGYLLDGFPRTLSQARSFEKQFDKEEQLLILHLAVPDSVLLERVVGRLTCGRCHRLYHKKWDPPIREGICDSCSEILLLRDDDREEVFRKRLEVYRSQTEPLLDYYRGPRGLFREIEGHHAKEEVFQAILQVVSL